MSVTNTGRVRLHDVRDPLAYGVLLNVWMGCGQQRRTQKGKDLRMKIIRKIMATVTAAACVVAFNTVAVSSAFAANSNGKVTVALTIIDNSDPNDPDIIANRYVTVSEGATVTDMLGEAGFTEAASLEETKTDSSAYCLTEKYSEDSLQYPQFKGMAYNSNTGMYWIDVCDGAADVDGTKTAVTSTVTNGAHYQYIYDAASYDESWNITYNFSYSDYSDLISDPLSADAVNTYCSILPKKFTKKNITYVDWYMGEIETIFNALSNAEKEKVAYDVVQLRDSIIKAQDGFALGNVAKNTTVKAKANKKVTVTLKKVTSDSGNKVRYVQKTKNAKVTVNTNGKVTVKKGLKKNVNVKVVAYCGVEATKNITIKVKAA